MTHFPEGNALVYCEGNFHTTDGKTAHGLVRRTHRYRVMAVIDSVNAGRDAAEVLDGKPNGIPIVASLAEGLAVAQSAGVPATHMVIGIACAGGRMTDDVRGAVRSAILAGLNVDSGLHDFMTEDAEFAALAAEKGVVLRDIRKPQDRRFLHHFTGKIAEVDSLKVAILGIDSAIGKRTTCWVLLDALNHAGIRTEMVGTGQTAWMQGVRFGLLLDTVVNDFLAGEIEHAVWTAWKEARPQVILLEGQGSLMNPAFPGGYELLAAARPDCVIVQHAPARKEYDGFPGFPMHAIDHQIKAIELVSGHPVVAITINHEGLSAAELPGQIDQVRAITRLPVADVLRDGPGEIVAAVQGCLRRKMNP